MKVTVRFFASLVELAGTAEETVEVAESAAVEQLWASLVERHPRLGGMGYRPLVACDRSYADWDAPLAGVAEVAFLPPVSGG